MRVLRISLVFLSPEPVFRPERSDRLAYLAGADATGADTGTAVHSALADPDSLQIRQETAFGLVVCVRNVVAAGRCFPTDFANLGHYFPPSNKNRNPNLKSIVKKSNIKSMLRSMTG